MQERKYTIQELYRHTFETIEELRAGTIDIAKAAEIRNLVQAAVNIGKVECRFIETAGGRGSGFMPEEGKPTLPRTNLRMLDRQHGE